MRLLDRLIKRDYWEGMASGAAVLTTSYGGPDREAVLPQWAAWAQQANASSAVVFSAMVIRMALFAEAVSAFGRVDVLFNNAGVFGPSASITDIGDDQWHTTWRTNVDGALLF